MSSNLQNLPQAESGPAVSVLEPPTPAEAFAVDEPEAAPAASERDGAVSVQVTGAAEFFRTLSDLTRLRILLTLAEKPHNVTDLRKRLGIPQPTTSHHLNQLRAQELVTSRRAGKQVFYSLAPSVHADAAGLRIRSETGAVELDLRLPLLSLPADEMDGGI